VTTALILMIATTTSDLDKSLARAPERSAQWQTLLSQIPAGQKKTVEFILTHMPLGDLKGLDPKVVADHVNLAFRTRTDAAYAKGIPESVFNDAVVPYCSVTETRQSKRQEFHDRYFGLVKNLKTPSAAALAINARLFADYKVTYNTKRLRTDQSSPETIAQGMATCTGLSIMLVDALRAVGVPARLAGIHTWPGTGGNHTWVEVWDNGWHYVGAAEPDPKGLDHAWFTDKAKTAIRANPDNAIYAVTYRTTGDHFPLAWDPGGSINAENVTDRYAPSSQAVKEEIRVEVRQAGSKLAADVKVWNLETGQEVASGKSMAANVDVNRFFTFPRVGSVRYFIKAQRAGKTAFAIVPGTEVKPVVLNLDASPQIAVEDELIQQRIQGNQAASRLLTEIPYSEALANRAWDLYRKSSANDSLRTDFAKNVVKSADRESPFKWRKVGREPKDGWALVVAMHGGGGTTKDVNDSQWEGMFSSYYKDHPEAGGYIYCALRAPNDEWNGFYDDAIGPLFENLIAQFAVNLPMDLNKVSITGASHGGYGAFVIGPKIPYRFAAVNASASAPTPGETAGENLRNVNFSWIVGEQDTAYGRADRCQEFEASVSKWKAKYGGYPGGLRFLKGVGHFVPDRNLTAELIGFTRNPWPKKVVWTQTDNRLSDFYWLTAEKPTDKGHLEATVTGNEITIQDNLSGRLTIWLSPKLVKFGVPVTITRNGKSKTVKPIASVKDYVESLLRRRDPDLAGSFRVDL
jgi:hypothetical protein